jgi:hypothetical protein
MEIIMQRMLKAITLTIAIILVIAPSIRANFVPESQSSFLFDMFQKVSTQFSPTTAYLLATGLISLILFDIKRTSSHKKRQ